MIYVYIRVRATVLPNDTTILYSFVISVQSLHPRRPRTGGRWTRAGYIYNLCILSTRVKKRYNHTGIAGTLVTKCEQTQDRGIISITAY